MRYVCAMGKPVLAVTATADREAVARGKRTRLFAAIEVSAVGEPAEAARAPLSVVFVVDASGSMQGPPIEQVLRSVESMLELLDAGDRLGLVAFSDSASEIVPLSEVSPETRRLVRARLPRVVADGYTNMQDGLEVGARVLDAGRREGARHALVLLSDGAPNRGAATTAARLGELAHGLRPGISTATLGYGEQHNEDVLDAIATGGGGSYRFIPDPVAARMDFARALGAQAEVVADGVELSIAPAQGVTIVRVVGAITPRFTSGGLSVPHADLLARGSVVSVLELDVDARREPGNVPLFQVTLRHRAAGKAEPLEAHADASIAVADAEGAPIPRAWHQVLLALGDEARAQARAQADRGQFEGAAALLRAMLERIARAPGYVAGDGSALSEAYEQLLDEAVAYERRPSAEQYSAFRKAQHSVKLGSARSLASSEVKDAGAYALGTLARTAGDVPVARLVVVFGPGAGARHTLGPLNALGRGQTCDVVLSSSGVSRRHAEVFALQGKFFVRDLGSTNITRVNGELVTGPSRELQPGDEIEVGDVLLRYEVDDPSRTP